MKHINKVLLVGGIIGILSLTQCDLVTTDVSKFFFPPKVMDFPMGDRKSISYPITSWVKKPYVIWLNTEFENYKYAWGNDNYLRTIPYHFSISCYKLQKGKEILFYKKEVFSQDIGSGNGWDTRTSDNMESTGLTNIIIGSGNDLSYGKYRCDFEDKSSKEIKDILKKAGITRTAIEISPFKRFIY